MTAPTEDITILIPDKDEEELDDEVFQDSKDERGIEPRTNNG